MKKLKITQVVLDAVQGTRRAETGMYVLVHEDFERALIQKVVTPQCAKNNGFARF